MDTAPSQIDLQKKGNHLLPYFNCTIKRAKFAATVSVELRHFSDNYFNL